MATLYSKVTGIALIVLAGAGLTGYGFTSDRSVIGLYALVGLVGAYIGFTKNSHSRWAMPYARVFGIVFSVLGVMGFIMPDLIGMLHPVLLTNIVHLVLGVWGIYVGYLEARQHHTLATA